MPSVGVTSMIGALTILLACQLVGEGLAKLLGLLVPGPVIGLALLATCLWIDGSRRPHSDVDDTSLGRLAAGLLASLGLLFVPAGAGIVGQLGVLGQHGLAIFAALLLSTIVTLIATVAIFRVTKRAIS